MVIVKNLFVLMYLNLTKMLKTIFDFRQLNHTLHEVKFHWYFNFTLTLMLNSLNLNSTYCNIFGISQL